MTEDEMNAEMARIARFHDPFQASLPTPEDKARFTLDLHARHSPANAEICAMVGHEWTDAGRDGSGGALCERCGLIE